MTEEWPRVRIWDAPVRTVHWLLVLLVGVSWWTAEKGQLQYHRYSGYTLLGLICFRIYWGFAGSSTARFAGFVRGPQAVLAYLRRLPERAASHAPAVPGHNPLGALSVLALLLMLLLQVTLGLFAVDVDGIESGPLSGYVSFDAGRLCADWHARTFNILLGLIALHVAAVLFYFFYKRDNLIAVMVRGWRHWPAEPAPRVTMASRARLLVGIVLAALVVWAIASAFQFRFR